jgi:hypothetical protein
METTLLYMAAGIRAITLAALCALAAGCRGGNGAPAGRTDGVLSGIAIRNGQEYAMRALASDGRLMAFDAGGYSYDGSYAISRGALGGTELRVYAINPAYGTSFDFIGERSGTAVLSGVVTSGGGWEGSLADAGGATTFTLDYDVEGGRQDSSLSFVAGQWRYSNGDYQALATIGPDGATHSAGMLNGFPFPCDGNGAASVIDADYGVYGWQTTIGDGCITSGPYTGLGILEDGVAPLDTLMLLLANETHFLALASFVRQ